jgi:predicted transposase/invertase (TIGR01784 family)
MLEQTRGYRDYRLSRTVYTIVWLTAKTNDPLHQHSLITTSFHSVTEAGETLKLYPHKLFFLNPNYVNDQTPVGLADWLTLVAESIYHPNQPHINASRSVLGKATQLIEDTNLTPEDLRLAIDDEEAERQLQHVRAEGRSEQSKLIARNLLRMGLSVEQAARATGLSEDDVRALLSD